MMRRLVTLAAAAAILLCGCGLFEQGIEIDDPWVRPALAGSNTAAYFRLVNRGADDRLLGAVALVASEAAIHRTFMDAQGMMQMAEQEVVEAPAGAELVFEPGGLHVMLLNLSRDLLVNERISITLVFEKAGEVSFDVPVESR